MAVLLYLVLPTPIIRGRQGEPPPFSTFNYEWDNPIHSLETRQYTVGFFHSECKEKIMLLKRDSKKLLFPDKYTGIGGKIELENGELDIWKAMTREFCEETQKSWNNVENPKLLAAVTFLEIGSIVNLFVFTGILSRRDPPPYCVEGELSWIDISKVFDVPLIPTARQILEAIIIPFFREKESSHPESSIILAACDPRNGRLVSLRSSLPENYIW